MAAALRFSTVSLLTPLLVLLRQSKGFLLHSGQALRAAGAYERAAIAAAVTPCRSKSLGLQRTLFTSAAKAEPATTASYQRQGIWRKGRRVSTMSADGGSTAGDIGGGGDVRKRFEAMHSAMLPEGKEEVLRQASREAHNRRQAAVFDSKVDFFAGSEATPQKQFPSLRRIAEACRPDGDGRVVDAGCGTGALVPFLKEAGVQEGDIVGIDMSPEMGSVFGERFPEAEMITADFIEFADEIMAMRLRPPPPAAKPAPPTPSAATATGDAAIADGGGTGGGGPDERIKRNTTAGDLTDSRVGGGDGRDKERDAGRRRSARTAGGGGGGGVGADGGVGRGRETERTQRKGMRTAGNVGGKRRTKTAGDVGGGSGGGSGSGSGQKQPGQNEQDCVVAREVGTVVFNSVFGNLWDQGAALERAASILEVGGKVVISHPLGRNFVSRLKAADETIVPHDLPERDTLERMVQFLPFLVESFESKPELYLAVLKKTPHRALETVRYLRGTVSSGYGRGSKKLGVPTANLPESQFAENLRSLPTGVYFGWAALESEGAQEQEETERRKGDGGVGPWKCVANVGYSPTFAGQENAEKIVEGHLIGYEGGDFYGETMRMLLAGFQRREKKFASFPELVATINKDVGDASAALDEPQFFPFKADAFFSTARKGKSTPEAWSTRDFASAMEEAAEKADKPTDRGR